MCFLSWVLENLNCIRHDVFMQLREQGLVFVAFARTRQICLPPAAASRHNKQARSMQLLHLFARITTLVGLRLAAVSTKSTPKL